MRFLRVFPILFLVVALGACETTKQISEAELGRSELVKAEKSWKTVLQTIRIVRKAKLLRPGTEEAGKVAAFIAVIENSMEKWRANPDDVTAQKFAKEAIQDIIKLVAVIRSGQSSQAPPSLPYVGAIA